MASVNHLDGLDTTAALAIATESAQDGTDEGRVLLKDRAYHEIKTRILDGRFEPGRFLAERSLAHQLGMSKTPVRAAIGRLETEGFLAISPQQGIVVREMSFHEIVDHFDIRIALEGFVVRNVAGRLTPEQIARVEANLADQMEHARAGNVLGFVEADADYHLLFCEFLDNQEILRVMTRQRDKLYRVIYKVLLQDTRRMFSGEEEHAMLAKAVITGDAETAASVVQQHLEYGKRSLVSNGSRRTL